MDARQVTLLDIYNQAIYPHNAFTRKRVDIDLPLAPGTGGSDASTGSNAGCAGCRDRSTWPSWWPAPTCRAAPLWVAWT